MAQRPCTPVKLPSSAANHSAATLDPDLRSQINTVLLRDGHVTKIQEALLHSLNANSSNWPTAVQSHALALLRSGEITTFPALLRRVLDDIRADSAASSSSSSSSSAAPANGDHNRSLAVPALVVDEALKTTRECLEAICEIDDQPSTAT